MGKTVESYRMALEDEIRRWNGFAKALRSEDKEAFEELMDACRSFASAGSNATQPILFEPMIMSILLFQQKKLHKLEKELDAIKQQSSSPNVFKGWIFDVYPSARRSCSLDYRREWRKSQINRQVSAQNLHFRKAGRHRTISQPILFKQPSLLGISRASMRIPQTRKNPKFWKLL